MDHEDQRDSAGVGRRKGQIALDPETVTRRERHRFERPERQPVEIPARLEERTEASRSPIVEGPFRAHRVLLDVDQSPAAIRTEATEIDIA